MKRKRKNKTRKYPLNRWTPTLVKTNGQYSEVLIYPYRDKKGKLNYKYKKRQFHDNNRRNDSAACNHSDLIKKNFDVEAEGVDIPKSNTEIKETRQDKYWLSEKDREAGQILFYNHESHDYKLVKKADYEKEMGTLDHNQTPTQVDKMKGFQTQEVEEIEVRV